MSPSRRLALYVGPPLRELLDARGGEGNDQHVLSGAGVSGIINTVADRYTEILRRSVPTLSEREWMACADALHGVWLTDAGAYLAAVWIEIKDGDRLSGLGRKWGIDAHALAMRLREAPYAELVALVDLVERLWLRTDEDRSVRLRALLDGTTGALPPLTGRDALADPETGEDAPLTDDQAEALVHAIRAGDRVTYDGLCAAWGVRNHGDVWRATRRRLHLDPGREAPCPHCGQPASETAPTGCPSHLV